MSKLDDILSQSAATIADGVTTNVWKNANTKQKIKDLMLEIVDGVYSDSYENDKKATEMWHEICNKIKEL